MTIETGKEPKIVKTQAALNSLLGLPVTYVWFGDGEALFLELGELEATQRKDGSHGRPKGAVTITVYCSWRIESNRTIVCGSGDSKRRTASIEKRLVSSEVSDIQVLGRIPELRLRFSNNLWLQTFSRYAGQPDWGLLFRSPEFGGLGVKAGRLYLDERTL